MTDGRLVETYVEVPYTQADGTAPRRLVETYVDVPYGKADGTAPRRLVDQALEVVAAIPSLPDATEYPSTLTDNALWLRAKDLNSVGTATSWPDRSGAGHHGVYGGVRPTAAASSTPNGGQSAQFSDNGWLLCGDVLGYSAYSAPAYTATSAYPSELPGAAFDGNTATYWTTNGVVAAALQVQFGGARTATGYSIRRRDDLPNRNPNTWTFEGSNNGSSWTTLDTRSGITWPTAGETKPFTFSNSTGYSYYRINITANNGDVSYTSIAELAVTYSDPLPAAETWIVVKSESTGIWNGLWSWNNRAAANAHSFYPFNNGSVYETFGVASANTPATATSVQSWKLYRVTNDGTNLRAYLNGALVATLPVATMGGLSWGTNVVIGATYYNTGTQTRFLGKIAEVLTRKVISTSGEAAGLIDYFNTEHGLGILAPPVATVAVSAPVPTLTIANPPGVLAAPVATVTVSAPAPTLTMSGPLTLAAPTATATVSAPDPTLAIAGGPITLAAPTATVTASAPAPSITIGGGILDLGTATLNLTPLSLTAQLGAQRQLGPATLNTTPLSLTAGGSPRGTLANPEYVAAPSTVVVDLSNATLVIDDPPIVTGPANAPSYWLSFIVDADYEMTIVMDDTGSLSEMEVWVGPSYTQTGANVRLVTWTGSTVVGLDPHLNLSHSAQVRLPTPATVNLSLSLTATLSV